MRILLILDWNRRSGGAEAYATWLRDGLRAAGDEVRMLTSSAGAAGDGTADYVALGANRHAAQAFLQIVNPFAAATVRRAVAAFRPDVAWVNMFAYHLSPAVVFALGSLPKLLMVSDYKLTCPLGSKLLPDGSLCGHHAGWVCHGSGCLSLPHWLRDQPRYALIRAAVNRCHRILTCSSWITNDLAQEGIPSEPIVYPIPPPSAGYRRRPVSQPTLLYCGRLAPEKGVDLLLRAFARVHADFSGAVLRIAGEGDSRPSLEGLARSLGIAGAVRFLGWRTPQQVEEELAGVWASVAPSLWAEPFGLVATEATVRGVPLIASSAGGLGDLVEPGVTGLRFPNGDENALADCLRAVLSGSAFPGCVLSDAAVANVALGGSMERHIATIRRIFAETIRSVRLGPAMSRG